MPECFISYSTTDADFAEKIAGLLRSEDVEVFMAPLSLATGEEWSPRILEALRESESVVFLASKQACASPYVQQEVGGAIVAEKKLVPVVWDMPASELPGWAAGYQALDLGQQSPAQMDHKVRKLAKELQGGWSLLQLIAGAVAAAYLWKSLGKNKKSEAAHSTGTDG